MTDILSKRSAEALQISVATVKNRLRESRRHLKERMYEMADEVLAEERVALSIRSVVPLLTVYDVHRSIAFYRDVLGFEVKQHLSGAADLDGRACAGTISR